MSTIPQVFVSATSDDLGSFRKAVSDVLLMLKVHPVEQDHSPPDHRPIADILREQIADCDAVICLVGRVYGQEPHVHQPDEPRRSYTQWEHDIAVELGKPVFTFFPTDDCPPDISPDEPEELRTLQREHVQRLKESDHRWDTFRCVEELREKVGRIRFDPQSLRETLNLPIPCTLEDLLRVEAGLQQDQLHIDVGFLNSVIRRQHDRIVFGLACARSTFGLIGATSKRDPSPKAADAVRINIQFGTGPAPIVDFAALAPARILEGRNQLDFRINSERLVPTLNVHITCLWFSSTKKLDGKREVLIDAFLRQVLGSCFSRTLPITTAS